MSFAIGAALPLLAAALVPASASSGARIAATLAVALVALFALGVLGAVLGGARVGRPTARVVVGGLAAMAITMAIGKLFGTATG